jgi:hypothetical protein
LVGILEKESLTEQRSFLLNQKCFQKSTFLQIGLLLAPKYMDFIFFPESTLKKLLKSKFSEFLEHSLILYSISKSAI